MIVVVYLAVKHDLTRPGDRYTSKTLQTKTIRKLSQKHYIGYFLILNKLQTKPLIYDEVTLYTNCIWQCIDTTLFHAFYVITCRRACIFIYIHLIERSL